MQLGEAPSSGPRHAAQMADAAQSARAHARALPIPILKYVLFISVMPARFRFYGLLASPPLGLVVLVFLEKTD